MGSLPGVAGAARAGSGPGLRSRARAGTGTGGALKQARSAARRPVPFALRLVLHQKRRTAVAAAGIGFAILVIFMQLGFFGAVEHTALAISSRFRADLVLVSPRFARLADAGTIDRARLYQARAVSDVEAAVPIFFRYADWRVPETAQRCRLFAVGFPLDAARETPPIDPGVSGLDFDRLNAQGSLFMDRLSQEKCRPVDPDGLVEVRDKTARVVGEVEIGVGFLADGAMLISDDTFIHFFDGHPIDRPHLGLLRLRPGADRDAAKTAIAQLMPTDVRVLDIDELDEMQRRHWVDNTAVGNIFTMGSFAGFMVGVVVLYQILSTDIRNQLPYYATLKAMGYSNRRLYGYVFRQSWVFAGLGFVPALIVSAALFPFIHSLTRLPVFMTIGLATFIGVLSLVMCTIAASISLRKLGNADPAELF
jgi:putative ABC transport system permease protein